jgi:dihydrodipicolinate synthase/N-acetylneuraminate lyase
MPAATPRSELLSALFPAGVPALWCPLITHYTAEGDIDAARIAAHLEHLAPRVKGFLMPGSTGDGWELSDVEIRRLLEVALEQAARLDLHLLIGVLKTESGEVRRMMQDTVEWLKSRTGESDALAAMKRARVCGFTVCPPKGRDLSQAHIERELAGVLELGLPTSLYQLPQVTQNEMAPETVAALADRFPNFILFKDTSGADRVAAAGLDLGGVFLVRGAERDYAQWPKSGSGPYDGFLLSTANGLAAPLARVIDLLQAGHAAEAGELSARLTTVVDEVFALAAPLPFGNAFANANKAIDHCCAHGPGAVAVIPPRTHAGPRLPESLIHATAGALGRCGFLPESGYLK